MFVIEPIESGWEKHFSVRPLIVLALIATLIMAVVVLMLRQPEPLPPVNLSVPATPAPEVKKQPRVEKPIKAKTVKVFKPAIKKALKLPEVVQADPVKEVVASSQVKADDHPQTITTLINTDTGEFETYTKRDPLPWFATEDRGEAGVALVLRNGEPAVRVDARQSLFQVKAVHFGGVGSVAQALNGNGKTDWEIGMRGSVNW